MILQIKIEKELNNLPFYSVDLSSKGNGHNFRTAQETMSPAVWTSTITPSFPRVSLETRPIRHRKDGRLSSFSKTTEPTVTFGPLSLAHFDLSCSCDKSTPSFP